MLLEMSDDDQKTVHGNKTKADVVAFNTRMFAECQSIEI